MRGSREREREREIAAGREYSTMTMSVGLEKTSHFLPQARRHSARAPSRSSSTNATSCRFNQRDRLASSLALGTGEAGRRRGRGRRDLRFVLRASSTAKLGETTLFNKAGVSASYFEDPENASKWNSLAHVLSEKLDIEVDSPRIQHYYLPVYLWIKKKLEDHKAGASSGSGSGPLCVGLSAPQGCGKTTLVTAFEELFESEGMTCVSMSLDDFYLTREEQVALGESHSENALLQVRGNAGTHDVNLAMDLIDQVKNASSEEVLVPCYDKTAYEGKGDRHKEDKWRSYNPKNVDVVLYEGWMQGFTAVEDEASLEKIHGGITEVNSFLKGYDEMWKLMDIWLIIQVKQLDCIYKWRLQAEKSMKEKFGQDKGMTDDEVKAFVDQYIPAYKAYLPGLYDQDNHTKHLGCESTEDVFMFEVDDMRSPVEE